MFEPKKFGKYLLIDKIAAGGLAELFQSKVTGAQGFEKLIAIKTILPHLAQENELISCFIDEAKLAALLNHQNIVQIYDFGDIDGTFYIAMQYLFGKDLRRVIDRAKEKRISIDLGYSLYITSLICSGLDYAHNLKDLQGSALKLIHRDITPQNIILTYDGDVKIVDFGIAKAAARSTLTQIGTIKGKVAHMSPEQASGQSIDNRSDIFSTGIILYELVTGQKMFTGDTMEILAKVRDCKFELAESIAPDLPKKVYSIIHRSLAKDPDKRYQSCGEMQTDLEDCIHELTAWPTSRGLSKMMNLIYEDDITIEENVMRKTATISINQVHQPVTDIDYQGTAAEIVFEDAEYNDTTKIQNYENIDDSKNSDGSFTKVIKKHEGSKVPVLMYASIVILALASIISLLIYMPNIKNRQQNELLQSDTLTSFNLNLSKNSGTESDKKQSPVFDQSPKEKPQVRQTTSKKDKKSDKVQNSTSSQNLSKIGYVDSSSELIENENSLYNSIVITKRIPKESNVETLLEVKNATKALNNNKYKDSVTLFEKAITNHPALATEITRFYAFNFREKGIKMQKTDKSKAKIYFSKAIKIEPSNPHNYFQLGLLYIRLNDFPSAIKEYNKALRLDFKSPTIYFNMGYAYAKLKNYKQAEAMFIKSINLNPPYIDEALFNLAVVQNLHGKNNAAVKNLKRILRANANNKKAKLLLSKINKEVG
jgi:serine/threonine protein kinase